MTLRKFLRFFKHFGYYMKKDFRWLKNKLTKNREASNPVVDKGLKKFIKELKSIKQSTGSDHVVHRGNYYYICDKNKPYEFYKIWREGNVMHVLKKKNEKQFTVNPGSDKKHNGQIAIETVFNMSNEIEITDDEWFVIELGSKSNLSVVESETDGTKTYKIYQKCGVQRPRLEYTISWTSDHGIYFTTVAISRGNMKRALSLHYYPLQTIMQGCKH